MAKIFILNKKYSGVMGGVTFINGQGETDKKHLIDWFKSKGHTVGDKPQDPPAITKESLSALKRDELIDLAKKCEIEQPQKVKSEDLIKAILKKESDKK